MNLSAGWMPIISHFKQHHGNNIDSSGTWLYTQLIDAENQDHSILSIHLKSDGSKYTINNLRNDQKDILVYILQKFKLWISASTKSEQIQRCVQMTICGEAGSGKSTLINTIVTLLREMFQINWHIVGFLHLRSL